MLRPASWTRPAGVSPVRVGVGSPGSRPRLVVERWRAERGVKSLFGGSKCVGRSATWHESCSLVRSTTREPSRSCHGEGHEVEVEVRPEEVEMAALLIENMTRPFDTAEYQDSRRERIEDLVARKIKGEEIVVPESAQPTKVVDLLEALKASVEAAKAQRQAS